MSTASVTIRYQPTGARDRRRGRRLARDAARRRRGCQPRSPNGSVFTVADRGIAPVRNLSCQCTYPTGGPRVIRVFIADDQALVRAGFRMILDAQPDMEVVGEAQDGARGDRCGRRHRPDVILMDIRMPEMDGLEATRRIVTDENAAARADADHVRPRRVRLRGHAGGRERLPAQGRPARAARRRGADRRRRRRPPRAVDHAPPDRGVRPPAAARRTPPPELDDADRARARGAQADRPRSLERGDRGASSFVSDDDREDACHPDPDEAALRDRVQAVVLAYESGLVQPGG